ncbi:MAG TPA: universal stress protein [Solirubrobacter sp.]|nr:universal stress protein [Solirubrobacter sp.]
MSSVYRNILVAVDGSPDAEAALAHAAALARDQRARLTLLTAIPPLPATAMLASGAAPPRSEVVRHYSEFLRRAAETLPEDVSVTTLLVEGPPARALIERSKSGQFDLIVMGSHGHGRLHTSLLGCVSQKVLHASPVPVLLTRAPREEPAPAPSPAPVESSLGARPLTN